MAKELQDDDDHEQEEEAEQDPAEKERNQKYLEFRRTMDEYKGQQEGMTSESENFKGQGNAYFTFGCYSQATIMYSEAIELQPHNHLLYCNRAMAYLKQDMADLALADAIRSLAIEDSVDNIKAYWRKAQALLDLKKYEEAEAAAGDGLALHGNNTHLNKVRRKAREASTVDRLIVGEWVGRMVDKNIEQRLAFTKDGVMTMSVFGHSLTSSYELSVEGNPRSMVVRMKHEATPGQPPPPPMVYIFEFHDSDKELWLCHPVDGSQQLPEKFEGPGLVKHRNVAAAKPDGEVASNEPLEVRCKLYMRAMIKVLPLVPPQLPEKPSHQQISDEVEICGRVSELKRSYGLEVHRRAVELAKDPSRADGEEMQELAQSLRRRFTARKLLEEEPKAKVPPTAAVATGPAPPAPVSSPAPAAAEDNLLPRTPETTSTSAAVVPVKGDAPSLLSRLASCICG